MTAHHIALPPSRAMSETHASEPGRRGRGPGGTRSASRGHLAPRWAAWFDGMTLTHQDDGTTVIHGPVADQSALHGLLRKLSDLGLPLVSVTPLSARPADPAPDPKEHVMTTDTDTAPTTPPAAAGDRPAPDGPDAQGRPRRRRAVPAHVRRLDPAAEAVRGRHRRPRPASSAAAAATPPCSGARWLEVVTAVAGIGTAVALYPVTRRVSRTAAIGFVTSRVVEATLILVGVDQPAVRRDAAAPDLAGATGAQADALGVTGDALVAMRQWTFLLGPGLIAGVNGLFLGYVMYRAGSSRASSRPSASSAPR